MTYEVDLSEVRRAVDAIRRAYLRCWEQTATLEDLNLTPEARDRKLRELRQERDAEVRSIRDALAATVKADEEAASLPPERRLSTEGWAELSFRTGNLARELENARPDEALALYKRAAAQAPEWARSELARIAEPKLAGLGTGAFEFAQLRRQQRTDAERSQDARRAATRSVQARLGWLDRHIERAGERTSGADEDARVFDLWAERTEQDAARAAEQALSDDVAWTQREAQ